MASMAEVVGDHGLREREVGREQRDAGVRDGVLDPAAHRRQVLAQLVQLGVEDVPHVLPLVPAAGAARRSG